MRNSVHAELAKDERTFLSQILQPQEVTLEVALIVEIDIEAKENDVLRQQIFRGRKSGEGKQNFGIGRASDAHQMLDKLNHLPDAQPASHRARDFVADQVTQNC